VIAWFALALALGGLALWGAVFVLVLQGWRKYSPAVAPYLAMLAPQPTVSMRCEFGVKNIAGGTDLCTLPAGHKGYHTFTVGGSKP
jgi:hypothetical protein